MSKGALLLATPHDTIDYIGFAKLAAKLIEKHLGIDTHIHVGEAKPGNVRAFRWHTGDTERVQWHNSDRPLAYDLSPYEETLLIDVDYLTFNKLCTFYSDDWVLTIPKGRFRFGFRRFSRFFVGLCTQKVQIFECFGLSLLKTAKTTKICTVAID